MVAYRSGFIITPLIYLLSSAASAASLLKWATALHYYAYSGVWLGEVFRQRGEHFNDELLQMDALEDIKVRHSTESATGREDLDDWLGGEVHMSARVGDSKTADSKVGCWGWGRVFDVRQCILRGLRFTWV